jgi:hypothetical protein
MPSDLGYAVGRATEVQGRQFTEAEKQKANERLLALGKGALTAPFTAAPDLAGMIARQLRWTESGEPIFENPISGDPIREAVNLDPQDPWGWAGEFLDPTSGALKVGKYAMALPAVIKGGKNILKAKRIAVGRRLLPLDDAFEVAGTNAVVRKTIYKHPKLRQSIDGWSVQVPAPMERKTIRIKSPKGKMVDGKMRRRRDIEVLKNPTEQTLRRFMQTHEPEGWLDMGNVYGSGYEGALRYFKDADGNWYFWDGSEAIHWHVWKQLHPDKKSLFDTAAVHKITRPFSERLIQKDDVMKGRFTAESAWPWEDDMIPRYDPDNIEVFKEVGPGFENYQTAIDHLEANPKDFGGMGVTTVDEIPDTDKYRKEYRDQQEAANKDLLDALKK